SDARTIAAALCIASVHCVCQNFRFVEV
ncbi:hypothetical protein A2U01_0097938, partial [Trifolium medium]|nr:hypothetical protein [Trifolium medium]